MKATKIASQTVVTRPTSAALELAIEQINQPQAFHFRNLDVRTKPVHNGF